MILADAVKEFESLFASTRASKADRPQDLPVIWSGGQRGPADTAAAIYATRDLAIDAWLSTARSLASDRTAVLEWVVRPELIEYQTTIADMKQRHRLVGNRYTVRSQFVVVEKDGG